MAIVTIARQLGALGDAVAAELAAQLDYRLIDKQRLESKLSDCGLSENHLKRYDEKKPGFLASLNRDRDVYLNYLLTAVLEEAVDGKCVLLGRAAFAILSGVPDVVRIRLIASEAVRTERVMNDFNCDSRRAVQIVARSDSDRNGFHQSFFNVDPCDPANYHLVINTDTMPVGDIVNVIKNVVYSFNSPESEASSLALLKSKLIGQQIVNHLLFEKNLSIHFLESTADGNTITLYGVASSIAVIDQAIAVAKDMAQGRIIESAITVVNDYKSYP